MDGRWREGDTGRWNSSGEEFTCQECEFSTKNYRTAQTHKRREGHNVTMDETPEVEMEAGMGEWHGESSRRSQRDFHDPNTRQPNVPSNDYGPVGSANMTMEDSDDEHIPDDDEEPPTVETGMEEEQWHPYKNFTHFILVLLYHGSHQHKISRSVVKVLLLAFKQFTEDIPTLDDILNFRCSYWDEKLLRKVESNGDTFSFISPAGQLAMRLANPLYSGFERMPYCPDLDSDKVREGQSSGKKWWNVARCNSLRFNDRSLYEGDSFLLGDRAVRFSQFFKHKENVYVEVHLYSKESEEVNQTGSSSTVILIPHLLNDEQISEQVKLDQFANIESLREQNVRTVLSRFKLIKNEEDLDFHREEISAEDIILTPNVEQSILQRGVCVVTCLNVHLDDTSMNPQSKVWKSATCVSQQLAGAPCGPGGWKHSDAGTMMIAVAPAKQMSPIQILQCMRPEFDILQEGFQAYDIQSKGVVSVKAGIGVVEGDLDSQRQLSPFKGAAGYAFCQRDLINKDTLVEEEEDVEMRSREQLAEQINEIENAPTQHAKQQLCRKYGVVAERYPPVTDMFLSFDLFRDMSCDTLHLKILGLDKKFLIAIKEHLSEEQLKRAASLLDSVMHPVLYKNRPSSNVVLSPGSQIGRSIKAALQVFYFGLHLAGVQQRVSRAAFNLAELNLMLFTESDTQWDEIALDQFEIATQRCLATIERDFPECISPKAHYLKWHMLSDIDNHGNPSSYNTQGGERKMKCEKICQTYSNKKNTNRDTTNKLISVEVTRHIVTKGVFSDEGEQCGKGVELFCQSAPCREYLGLIQEDKGVKLKLGDWQNKALLKSRPQPVHVAAGCPDISSSTWKRLTVDGVKIIRGSGVKFRQRNRSEICGMIKQIYKNEQGVFAIANKLNRIRCDDQFISFTCASVYDLSHSCVLVENLSSLKPHVLIHGCNLEESPCPFIRSGDKIKLSCIGSSGVKFVHNRVALTRFN